jgi:hypothetical protein
VVPRETFPDTSTVHWLSCPGQDTAGSKYGRALVEIESGMHSLSHYGTACVLLTPLQHAAAHYWRNAGQERLKSLHVLDLNGSSVPPARCTHYA